MRSLDFLVGEWTATVEFFEPGGRRSGTLGSRTVVEPIFDGMMLQQEGTLEGTPMRTLSHYLIDRNSGMITWTALDSLGGHHIFHGGFENRELVLISDPVKTSDRTLLFKRIDRRIDANAYEFSMYTSSDNGTTWTLGNRQVNRRVAPPSGH